MNTTSDVKKVFDSASEKWQDNYSRKRFISRWQVFQQAIAKYYIHSKNEAVLEIGCGAKSMFDITQYPDSTYFSTDISLNMLKHNGQRGNLFQSQIEYLPLKAKFDLIIMSSVIEWLQDPYSTPLFLYNIVKAQGHLLVSIPNTQSLLRIFEKFIWEKVKQFRGREHYTKNQYNINFNVLNNKFCERGYHLVNVFYCGRKIFFHHRYSSSLSLLVYRFNPL